MRIIKEGTPRAAEDLKGECRWCKCEFVCSIIEATPEHILGCTVWKATCPWCENTTTVEEIK